LVRSRSSSCGDFGCAGITPFDWVDLAYIRYGSALSYFRLRRVNFKFLSDPVACFCLVALFFHLLDNPQSCNEEVAILEAMRLVRPSPMIS
jgi:hypothetical protein